MMEFLGDDPCIIAEVGCNHGGDAGLAAEMIAAAAGAGARFVKLQNYSIDEYVSRDHPAHAAFAAEALSGADFQRLAGDAARDGVTVFSTPFDLYSADFLDAAGVPLFKISSGDITYLPLLRHVAAKGKPILLSTGACDWEELDAAVAAIRAESDAELVLLHCTAAYPAPDDEMHLALIPALVERYGLPVGFSDHSLGIDIALAGAALGAWVIEKHFTTDQSLEAGDNDMSITPDELQRLIAGSARVARALGVGERRVFPCEEEVSAFVRRSLVARGDLPAGRVLAPGDLVAVRPSGGLPAVEEDALFGRSLRRGLAAGQRIAPGDLD